MEGICFAELNPSAGEARLNLVGVVSSYLGCLFPGFITLPPPSSLAEGTWSQPFCGLRCLSATLPTFSISQSSKLTAEGEPGLEGLKGCRSFVVRER